MVCGCVSVTHTCVHGVWVCICDPHMCTFLVMLVHVYVCAADHQKALEREIFVLFSCFFWAGFDPNTPGLWLCLAVCGWVCSRVCLCVGVCAWVCACILVYLCVFVLMSTSLSLSLSVCIQKWNLKQRTGVFVFLYITASLSISVSVCIHTRST